MSPGQLSQLVRKRLTATSFHIAYIIDCNNIIQPDDLTNLPTAHIGP